MFNSIHNLNAINGILASHLGITKQSGMDAGIGRSLLNWIDVVENVVINIRNLTQMADAREESEITTARVNRLNRHQQSILKTRVPKDQ